MFPLLSCSINPASPNFLLRWLIQDGLWHHRSRGLRKFSLKLLLPILTRDMTLDRARTQELLETMHGQEPHFRDSTLIAYWWAQGDSYVRMPPPTIPFQPPEGSRFHNNWHEQYHQEVFESNGVHSRESFDILLYALAGRSRRKFKFLIEHRSVLADIWVKKISITELWQKSMSTEQNVNQRVWAGNQWGSETLGMTALSAFDSLLYVLPPIGLLVVEEPLRV